MYNGWNKNLGDELVTIDIRKGNFSYESPYGWDKSKMGRSEVMIRPTVQADMRFLPFRENIFEAVIFDPPHAKTGLGSWIWRKYGSWTLYELIRTVRSANEEFKRVLKPGGFIIMKIYRQRWPLYKTLLKNFVFFLPIERRTGAYTEKSKRKILWAIGQVKRETRK